MVWGPTLHASVSAWSDAPTPQLFRNRAAQGSPRFARARSPFSSAARAARRAGGGHRERDIASWVCADRPDQYLRADAGTHPAQSRAGIQRGRPDASSLWTRPAVIRGTVRRFRASSARQQRVGGLSPRRLAALAGRDAPADAPAWCLVRKTHAAREGLRPTSLSSHPFTTPRRMSGSLRSSADGVSRKLQVAYDALDERIKWILSRKRRVSAW